MHDLSRDMHRDFLSGYDRCAGPSSGSWDLSAAGANEHYVNLGAVLGDGAIVAVQCQYMGAFYSLFLFSFICQKPYSGHLRLDLKLA